MAEELDDGGKKKSSPLNLLIMGGLVLVVPLTLALLVFQFVLSPMLGGEEPAAPVKPVVDNAYPAGAMAFEFEEVQAAVLPDDPDLAAPVLLYRVAMVCKDQLTNDLVSQQQVYFTAMLDKLHRNRTRSELNDPLVQETILKQARQEANTLLKRLAPEAELEIIEVLYVKFGMIDL